MCRMSRKLMGRTGRTGTRRAVHGAGRDEQGQHEQPHAPESALFHRILGGLRNKVTLFCGTTKSVGGFSACRTPVARGRSHSGTRRRAPSCPEVLHPTHGTPTPRQDRHHSAANTRPRARSADPHESNRPAAPESGSGAVRIFGGTGGRKNGAIRRPDDDKGPDQRRQMTLKSQKRHVSASAHWRKGCAGSNSSASVSRTSSSKGPSYNE